MFFSLPDSILVNSRCMLSVTTRRPIFSFLIRYLKRRQNCGWPSGAASDVADCKNTKFYTPRSLTLNSLAGKCVSGSLGRGHFCDTVPQWYRLSSDRSFWAPIGMISLLSSHWTKLCSDFVKSKSTYFNCSFAQNTVIFICFEHKISKFFSRWRATLCRL